MCITHGNLERTPPWQAQEPQKSVAKSNGSDTILETDTSNYRFDLSDTRNIPNPTTEPKFKPKTRGQAHPSRDVVLDEQPAMDVTDIPVAKVFPPDKQSL